MLAGGRAVNKLICAVLIAGALCCAAKGADAESSPPSCLVARGTT